jgi:hypothetical protein
MHQGNRGPGLWKKTGHNFIDRSAGLSISGVATLNPVGGRAPLEHTTEVFDSRHIAK